MVASRTERRLAAILATDAVGFSRLMSADEDETLQALNTCRALIDAQVETHGGRVFGSAGDSVVAEFASAVEATRCALGIREGIQRFNATRPASRRMRFRIAVNLGDVIVSGDTLMGDGVNVAAHLQALADPGGVLLSGSAFDQIEGKLDHRFDFVGRKTLKNIARPIRVYRLHSDGRAWLAPLASRISRSLRWSLAIAATLLLAVLVLVEWPTIANLRDVVALSSRAPEVVPLPARPSIAVLPFVNLNGEPEQRRFADGLTDNVITGLSRFPELFVVASQSSFTYRDQPVNVRQVSQELGVRYVLEGSIERVGDRLRVNAQLIDATQGNHLWAERYDREWTDFFAVQDELTERIVGTLGGADSALLAAHQRRIRKQPTESLRAYDYVLRAADLYDEYTKENNTLARQAALSAIDIDPRFALAHAYVAWTYMAEFWWAWSDDPKRSVAEARDWARKAVALGPNEYQAQWALGDVYQAMGDWEQADTAYEKALALNPNDPELLHDYGAWILPAAGRADEGIALVEKAMRLNPRHPDRYFGNLALNLYLVGRYQDAVAAVNKMSEPRFDHRLYRAASYGQLGRAEDARADVAEVARERPDMTIERFLATFPFRNDADREHLRAGLLKAGMSAAVEGASASPSNLADPAHNNNE
jgi:adenylate cyclase